MLEYKLDDLGWELFEQLIQSLLKARLGLGIEGWGGSGDWGRDAYFHGKLNYPTNEPCDGGFVFQCKFVEAANAAGAKPEKAILDAVRKECVRIKVNLGESGHWAESPTCYAFFTNAVLTPKTRSNIEQLLADVLPRIKIRIHDGHDICQWLRLSPDVLRTFEALNPVDQAIQKVTEAVDGVGEKVGETQKKEIRAKLNLAQTLARQEKRSDGLRELEAALALAQAAKLAEEEVEVLLALGLLSSSRRGIGNRRGYLDQAEKKIGEIKSASVRVLYFRARSAACSDERNRQGAEDALRLALECCEKGDDDKDKNLETQACAVRSELIILLCEQDRQTEAGELVAACEAHARAHASDEDGELMQAAMSAGIFWALKTGNQSEAIGRIHELETTAKTAHQAGRIGGQLSNMANNSSHMGFHAVALAAAEAAVRLGRKAGDKDGFDLGALYTVAVVTFHAGDHATAKRKAEALLDACNDPKDAIIKQAANHLIAEIARGAGDAETAVVLASEALASASGRPEDVAFTKQAVARALSDDGQTEEALAHAREAFELMKAGGVPAHVLADVLFQVVNYSSVLGKTEEASEALNAISLLKPDGHNRAEARESIAEVQETAPKLAEMNAKLRERIIEIVSCDVHEHGVAEPNELPLEQANAQVVKHLLDLWTEAPEFAATSYDYWGRGNFARVLRNARTISSAFNVTLEVRTLDGLKQAIRLWALYADMLLLIWKGPTEDGWVKGVLPATSDEPGGCGYIAAAGTTLKKAGSTRPWYLCMSHASLLPPDVVAFLTSEARPLLAAGRVFVVPATGVGCVHPGHGPLEQLLTESANAVAGLRGSGKINEVPIGLIPYSPDAPFDLLADIAQAQQGELRKLRRLLVRRTRELAPNEAGIIANKELALEIDDVLRDLADQQTSTARKRGVASAKEPLNGSFCRFHRDGSKLLPCSASSPSPFAPLLTLQNFGYKWGVGSPSSQPQGRYEPGKESVIGPWLALPTERWSILAVRPAEE